MIFNFYICRARVTTDERSKVLGSGPGPWGSGGRSFTNFSYKIVCEVFTFPAIREDKAISLTFRRFFKKCRARSMKFSQGKTVLTRVDFGDCRDDVDSIKHHSLQNNCGLLSFTHIERDV